MRFNVKFNVICFALFNYCFFNFYLQNVKLMNFYHFKSKNKK